MGGAWVLIGAEAVSAGTASSLISLTSADTRRTAELAVPTSPEWLRVRRVGDEAVVETAPRTYGRGGRTVALVGVVHVA